MEITLKGNEIADQTDFHQQIKAVLNLPDYYGGNLDALWDCLTGWVTLPLTLVWDDFDRSSTAMPDDSLKLEAFLQDAQNQIPGFHVVFR